MTILSKIRGMLAVILIAVLLVLSFLLPRVPKRIAWAAIAVIALIATYNEIK